MEFTILLERQDSSFLNNQIHFQDLQKSHYRTCNNSYRPWCNQCPIRGKILHLLFHVRFLSSPGLGLPPPTLQKPVLFCFFSCHADPWVSVLEGPFLGSLCELLALYGLQLILLGAWHPHPASLDPICLLGEGWGGPGGMGPDF